MTTAAPTRPVRFGILGCADIARRRMMPALAADPCATITAVASRDTGKARGFSARFGGESVTGYDALLRRADVDAVYVPLPAVLHAQWIARALDAGKHVLAEKPLTTDAEATRSLVHLARAKRLVLFENFMFLLHAQHRRVRELLAAGTIGEVRGFSSTFTIPPKPPDDIRYRRDVGGGALDDIGVYPIRAATFFLGDELEVTGAVLRRDPVRDVVVSGSVLLHTPQGVPAQLRFGMEHSYRAGYEVAGSDGVLSLDRAFTPPATYQPVLRIERQDHREELLLPADDQFANVVSSFTAAVLGARDLRAEADASLRQAELVAQVKERAELITAGGRPATVVAKGTRS
ncbi:Gfo/Idh/MocA family protein [Micromonospora echinospora]|uniref:Gfo/Idh/MocA family protein n=1 Tax=Micromonospora echinospora TaxID=1877 RepID=UPI003CF7CBC2